MATVFKPEVEEGDGHAEIDILGCIVVSELRVFEGPFEILKVARRYGAEYRRYDDFGKLCSEVAGLLQDGVGDVNLAHVMQNR